MYSRNIRHHVCLARRILGTGEHWLTCNHYFSLYLFCSLTTLSVDYSCVFRQMFLASIIKHVVSLLLTIAVCFNLGLHLHIVLRRRARSYIAHFVITFLQPVICTHQPVCTMHNLPQVGRILYTTPQLHSTNLFLL